MKLISKPRVLLEYTVEFGPTEKEENKVARLPGRCLSMGPAKDWKTRKPWGLREATFQVETDDPKNLLTHVKGMISS